MDHDERSMDINELANTCSVDYLFNLGGYGSLIYESQKDFDEALRSCWNEEQDLVCVSNKEQMRARTYLEKQGWTTHDLNSRVKIHFINSQDLSKYFENATYDSEEKTEKKKGVFRGLG